MLSTLVVFSSDQAYFPLVRGLVLSLIRRGVDRHGIGMAFIDVGCNDASLRWLADRGVIIRSIEQALPESLKTVPGYHRAQVCRPFLPRLFPEAKTFLWLDSDLWVQGQDVLPSLSAWANANPEKLFICPEWHYSYLKLNGSFNKYQLETFGYYYGATYGPEVAAEMSSRPMLNTGVFAMAAANPLWEEWQQQVELLYARDYGDRTHLVRHMAEQISLNVLAFRRKCDIPVDPLFNYMCTWAPPHRDDKGVVRVTLPPYSEIGIVHLSNWRHLRSLYWQLQLLFDAGAYLTDDERNLLLAGAV